MDPFVLSRNAFQNYCSEYQSKNIPHQTAAIQILNQRYEYFLQTLDRLRILLEHNRNINSMSNSAKDKLTVPSLTKKRSKKNKSTKQKMPRISIKVSCAEHRTKQQL
jgi:hypothetical protein